MAAVSGNGWLGISLSVRRDTIDTRGFAGDLGTHSDCSADALDGQ